MTKLLSGEGHGVVESQQGRKAVQASGHGKGQRAVGIGEAVESLRRVHSAGCILLKIRNQTE